MPVATVGGTRIHYLEAEPLRGASSPGGAVGPRVPRSEGPLGPRVPRSEGPLGPRVPRSEGPLGPRVPRSEGPLGPPVLCLHAFPLSARMWERQLVALAPRRAVVAPDLKGFGLSDAPDDPSAYSMDSYADDVAGLVADLDLGPVVVAGLSMGGYIAFALLRRHPALVAALVLADTKAAADPPEILERRTAQQQQVAEQGTAELVEAQLGALLCEHTRRHRPDVVDAARQLMDQPAAGVIGALEAMKQRPDSTDDLAGIDVPTLVLVGEDDATAPPDVAAAMAERLPKARLEVLPRSGHLSNLEAPDEFNRAVSTFLDEL